MKFSVVTIFPDLIKEFLKYGLISKAIKEKLIEVEVYDLREFTSNKHRKVDDRPFGGGAGMVMKPEPLFNAVESILEKKAGQVILFSAYGKFLDQKKVKKLSRESHLVLICGRYEGVDQRVINSLVDEEISIGEYVMMGGEVAAEVVIECVSRMIKGVVGNPESLERDSFFYEDQYAFPQYTQPREFRGLPVPEILLCGNHEQINAWRKKNQKKKHSGGNECKK
jgi:tRNA (guanine37-N1)-methyltransferase